MRWRNDNARRLCRILGSGIQKGKQVDGKVGQEMGARVVEADAIDLVRGDDRDARFLLPDRPGRLGRAK